MTNRAANLCAYTPAAVFNTARTGRTGTAWLRRARVISAVTVIKTG